MKNRIWPVAFASVFLLSCQSSRFMQDDMYFSSFDAKREVREYEVYRNQKNAINEMVNTDVNPINDESGFNNDEYYDYTYTSRIRRFNTANNTWRYYDPYYTNYYWYNNSTSKYFGNSVYNTYSWWGPNYGSNYSSKYWKDELYGIHNPSKRWQNPWANNQNPNTWWNPFKPYSSSINTHSMYSNLYYNSFDNNCYVTNLNKGDGKLNLNQTNFVTLMQKNGIRKNVMERPAINYTAIREASARMDSINLANATNGHEASMANINPTINKTETITVGNNSQVVINESVSVNSKNKPNNTDVNKTTNTTKRWDNHNADLNISPNSSKENNSWSRSGVFSEGSRNNNYEYKGSAIPKDKKGKTKSSIDQK